MNNILLNISFEFNYIPILIVIGTAWFVPIILSLLKLNKLPTVIIEIIAGFIVGKFILVHFSSISLSSLEPLALSGFIFLMFLSGLEIDTDQIAASLPRRKISFTSFLKNPLLVGISFFIISLILSYLGALLLSKIIEIKNLWYFALIMVTTSVGIILPVLKNRSENNSRFGQMVITAAAIADIFSIILFSFTAFILKNGFKLELIFIIGLIVVFYFFYKIGLRASQKLLFKKLLYQLSHAASQIQVRGTLFIILIFVVLSQFIGNEIMLLGAFLSGLLLSIFSHKGRSLLLIKLDGIGYGFFIPIFFIMVGAQFDISAFYNIDSKLIFFLLGLGLILFLIKIIPSFLWARLFGTRKAIAGGILMASRLSLIIAASKIGMDMKIIDSSLNASFILMAVFTCVLSPILYNYLNPKNIFEGNKIIIIGGSSSGVLLARRLTMHGKASVILESDKNRYLEILAKGLNTHFGNALLRNSYEEINLRPNDYVVVLSGNERKDIVISNLLRKEFYHENIITKATSIKTELKLKSLNVEYLDVTRVIATTIENIICCPTAYQTLIETFDNFSLEEIKVKSEKINEKSIKNIPFHIDGSIILIRRNNSLTIPHGDSVLKIGDLITVLGTETAHISFRKLLS
ncbi:MAG: cation:proton antiporter [Bacteroidota bacterium]|nr:cation:proton antiporter [Bacteroidota bacterium]